MYSLTHAFRKVMGRALYRVGNRWIGELRGPQNGGKPTTATLLLENIGGRQNEREDARRSAAHTAPPAGQNADTLPAAGRSPSPQALKQSLPECNFGGEQIFPLERFLPPILSA